MAAEPELTDEQLWQARAESKLITARNHFENSEYRDAVSDAYYAMFYMTRSALSSVGIESRRHSGAVALFSEHFVKPGKVDASLSRTLMRGLQLRSDADYGLRSAITRDRAKVALVRAEEFVAAVRKALD